MATPQFAYDFTERALYDVPGVITPPDPAAASPSAGRCGCRSGPTSA